MFKIVNYIEGNSVYSHKSIYEFLISTLELEDAETRIENFSLLQVECSGKVYFVFSEIFESDYGMVFELVESTEGEEEKAIKLVPIGTLYPARSIEENNSEIISKISEWWGEEGQNKIEELEKDYPLDFPKYKQREHNEDEKEEEDYQHRDDFEEGETDLSYKGYDEGEEYVEFTPKSKDGIERENELHNTIVKLKQMLFPDYFVSREFFEFLSSFVLSFGSKLCAELSRLGSETTEVPKETEQTLLTLQPKDIKKMKTEQVKKILKENTNTYIEYGKEREALFALATDHSRVAQLKQNMPKGMKVATLEHLTEAVKLVMDFEEFSTTALSDLNRTLEKSKEENLWKGSEVAVSQSIPTKMLIENGVYPSTQIAVGLASILQFFILEIMEIGGLEVANYSKGCLTPAVAKLSILLHDEGLAKMLSRFNEDLMKVNPIAKLEKPKISFVNGNIEEWTEDDTEKFREIMKEENEAKAPDAKKRKKDE